MAVATTDVSPGQRALARQPGVRNEFPSQRGFAWQEGFGSLTVSYSQIEHVCSYIRNQKEHHKRVSFEDEFTNLLKKHNVSYDPRFVFG